MPADPRDDFGVFESLEHMFFGLVDPYGAIRAEVENQLRAQVPDTVVERIVTHAEPRWRTIARRSPDGGKRGDDPDKLIVTYWGVCFRARLAVSMGYAQEDIAATITLLFGRWDNRAEQRVRTFFDLHGDAETGYDDAVFEQRFLAFRGDDP